MKDAEEQDYSAFLDKLTWKALQKWEKIITAVIDPRNRQYVRSLTIQERAANNIVRASIALGAQRLRARQTDKLGEMLERMKKAGMKPAQIEEAQRVIDAEPDEG